MDSAYLQALHSIRAALHVEESRVQRGECPSAGFLALLRHEFVDDWLAARTRWVEAAERTDQAPEA